VHYVGLYYMINNTVSLPQNIQCEMRITELPMSPGNIKKAYLLRGNMTKVWNLILHCLPNWILTPTHNQVWRQS